MLLFLYIKNLLHVTDDFVLYRQFSVIIIIVFFAVDIVFMKIEKPNIYYSKQIVYF